MTGALQKPTGLFLAQTATFGYSACMNLDRYDSTDARRRLSGRTEPRGTHTGFSTLGAALFGLPFFGMGIFIILVGTKVVAVDPKGVHAPYWVLTVFGSVFAIAGLFVWSMAWRQHAANRRREEAALRHGNEPALVDHAWDVTGYAVARWKPVIKGFIGTLFLTLFLSIFNYWAFFAKGPWMVKAIVILFDAVLVWVWVLAFMRLGRSIKFGVTRIEFMTFPYRPGETAVIRWWPAQGVRVVNQGAFTLRCVEEWYETTGHGKNRSKHLVHEQVWSGTWHVVQVNSVSPGQFVELRYDLPQSAPSTQLCADKPVFWELEVKLEMPGLDFEETYLVPVYAKAA